MTDFKKVTKCRVCGSGSLKEYLDLGSHPLANSLLKEASEESKNYPVEVLFCENCCLSQLSIVVDPKIMYEEYPYHSSISKTFQYHCYEMAVEIRKILNSNKPWPKSVSSKGEQDNDDDGMYDLNFLVVDIASNDGCLLEQFKKLGYYTLGVEPSKNLYKECEPKNLGIVNDYWSEASASRIAACDVITATNVLAHVDDVKDFLTLVKSKLRSFTKGIFVCEVPYFFNLITSNQFDTIYHEHLSYFLFKPLRILFSSVGLNIFKVEEYPIHGGSLRIYASPYKYPIDKSVSDLEEFEKNEGLYNFNTYVLFNNRVEKIKREFLKVLNNCKELNKTVMGYGASAKGISLINYCGADKSQITSIVDETPYKQWKFTPGSNIQISNFSYFSEERPDYILLLAWNFAEELMNKTKHLKTRYIVPIPEVRIL